MHGPSKDHLTGGLRMAFSNLNDAWQGENGWLFPLQIKRDIRDVSKVAIAHDCHAFFFADSEGVRLNQIGMQLNLKRSGFNRSIVEHFSYHLKLEVGDTNVFAESLTANGFHSLISLLVGDCFVQD